LAAWRPSPTPDDLNRLVIQLESTRDSYREISQQLRSTGEMASILADQVSNTFLSPHKPELVEHYSELIHWTSIGKAQTLEAAEVLEESAFANRSAASDLAKNLIRIRDVAQQVNEKSIALKNLTWSDNLLLQADWSKHYAENAVKVAGISVVAPVHLAASLIDWSRPEVRRAQSALEIAMKSLVAACSDYDQRVKQLTQQHETLGDRLKSVGAKLAQVQTDTVKAKMAWLQSIWHERHKELWPASMQTGLINFDSLWQAATANSPLSLSIVAYLRSVEGMELAARFTQIYPELAGNLDGFPSRLRDEANRTMLDRAIANESNKKKKIQLANLRDTLEKFDAQGERLLLLKFDPKGDGRIVVSAGDPDSATNVAVFIPGINNTAWDVTDNFARTSFLKQNMDKNGGSNAAIFYLDYDSPSLSPELLGIDDAHRRADSLGETLPDFLNGVVSQNPNAHVSVIAHSFGSFAFARLADRVDLPVDDVILIGSPGVPGSASDMKIRDGGQVWVGASPGDELKILQIGGSIVGAIALPIVAVNGISTVISIYGADPAQGSFGGKKLEVSVHVHNDYLGRSHGLDGVDSNTSSINIADIASGTLN